MKKLLTLAILGGLLLGTFLSIERKEVLENKYDVSIGAINGYSIDPTLKDFKTAAKVNGKDKVVDMVINSGGGSVHIGLEIIEEMKYMKSLGYKFNCYVRNAYSLGSTPILFAISFNTRLSKKSSALNNFLLFSVLLGLPHPTCTKWCI